MNKSHSPHRLAGCHSNAVRITMSFLTDAVGDHLPLLSKHGEKAPNGSQYHVLPHMLAQGEER